MPSRLLLTPSVGQAEVVTGLLRLGHNGRRAVDLQRHYFDSAVSVADVQTVLTALVGTGDVTLTAGFYKLTPQGALRAHQKRSTRLARRQYTA